MNDNTNPKNERRLGNFKLPRHLITTQQAILFDLFGHFIPVRAELLFAEEAIVYTAFSPLFRPVPSGEVIPDYTIVMRMTKEDERIHLAEVTAELKQAGGSDLVILRNWKMPLDEIMTEASGSLVNVRTIEEPPVA